MACDPIKKSKSLVKQVQKSAVSRAPGAPTIVRANSLGTRPFKVGRLVADLAGVGDDCAFERDQVQKFQKSLGSMYNRTYGRDSYAIPIAAHMLPDEIRYDARFSEMLEAMDAGLERDPARVAAVRKAMGSADQTQGGALVGPPRFGEFIPVLRPNGVFSNMKGAQSVQLGPTGAVAMPRATSTSTGQPGIENPTSDFDTTGITTDQVDLQSKALLALVNVSNQLLRNTEGAAESIIREDLGKALGTLFDKCGLEGTGSGNTIRGLTNIPGIGLVVAKSVGANGDTFTPEDYFSVMAAGYERNVEIDTWVMRPDMFLGLCAYRAGPVTNGEKTGPFLFDYARALGDPVSKTFNGMDTIRSTTVSRTRQKGSGLNLQYMLGLQAEQVLIGMHGAIEIETNKSGPGFNRNQTTIRAIMYGDVNVRQQAAVVLLDSLLPLLKAGA